MGLELRQPKSVHKTAIYGSFVGLKKVSIKLPYMAVLSTQKCVHRTALYGSSMVTLQNCRIWQLCPSVYVYDRDYLKTAETQDIITLWEYVQWWQVGGVIIDKSKDRVEQVLTMAGRR